MLLAEDLPSCGVDLEGHDLRAVVPLLVEALSQDELERPHAREHVEDEQVPRTASLPRPGLFQGPREELSLASGWRRPGPALARPTPRANYASTLVPLLSWSLICPSSCPVLASPWLRLCPGPASALLLALP